MFTATYRLQFRAEFPFAAAAALAPYLASLRISHVYSSPILSAREGSAHGYDGIGHEHISEALGGEEGFAAMAAALRAYGIGIILDIVPNHVAVGGGDNPMWLDLLRHGRASRYAKWFDVDFNSRIDWLRGKIHVPFLDGTLADVLLARTLTLRPMPDGSGHALVHGEHVFPIRPEDEAEIVAQGPAAFMTPARLGALASRQNYLLDDWRNAGDVINWRRFFDITQLAALRMENREAFDAVHAVPLRLYAEGLIDGLRIDHIDGLADPQGYCRTLREELDRRQPDRPPSATPGRALLVVEKILGHGELLPAAWDSDGTTGYDFMDQVSALQHDASSEHALATAWADISGRASDFSSEEDVARREVLDRAFDGQRERLVDAIFDAAPAGSGITRASMRRALTDVLAAMRAYRGYDGEEDALHPAVQRALDAARDAPMAEARALGLIQQIMRSADTRAADIRRLFNQLSAPLAAKAVEDTAFYRFGRLLSRNDVGFHAEQLGIDVAAFHRDMQRRAVDWPRSLLATATHDHKRGEDVRARLAVISEIPDAWNAARRRWRGLLAHLRPAALHPADEDMLMQTLVGCMPPALDAADTEGLAALAERVAEWWTKALREAKLRSSWAAPAKAYETAAVDFAKAILDPARAPGFLADIVAFVGDIAPAGAANALVQMTLRIIAPGIPDTYQGTEFWDFSLVDPDNRRPVDYAARAEALAAQAPVAADDVAALVDGWPDGRIKLALLARLLRLRAELPDVFASGSYEPIEVAGPRGLHAVAFMRRKGASAVLVVAGRLMRDGMEDTAALSPDPVWWGDAALALPADTGPFVPVVGPALTEDARVSNLLPLLPVGVWATRSP
jgi:(1->4)-alpha-D-glucan 1-alpha-D-glucosylmutase